jgi:prepilin signal peptidase PulO-like enzyme (type II secretory pathway)
VIQPQKLAYAEGATMDSRERVFYQLLTAFAVLRLWVLPIRSSFWLDETGTYWVIKDGLGSLFARAMHWSGQSPLYYLVAWLAHFVPGRMEVALRLPSLIAMIAAAWLLYKLAARLFDAETAPFALLIFVCSEHVAFAAADARPYALALFLLIASTWMLVRWLDSGRLLDAAVYVLLTALTIYAHVLLPGGRRQIRRSSGCLDGSRASIAAAGPAIAIHVPRSRVSRVRHGAPCQRLPGRDHAPACGGAGLSGSADRLARFPAAPVGERQGRRGA